MPPIYSDREKATDPKRGLFFRKGYADFFVAYRDDSVAGTLCCSHEQGGDPASAAWAFLSASRTWKWQAPYLMLPKPGPASTA